MIRLTVTYPATEGSTFDHDYYREHHVPLCVRIWAPIDAEIDRAIDGPNVAAVHLRFNTLDDLQTAMSVPGSADVLADVANYTSISPVLQISEIIQTLS